MWSFMNSVFTFRLEVPNLNNPLHVLSQIGNEGCVYSATLHSWIIIYFFNSRFFVQLSNYFISLGIF